MNPFFLVEMLCVLSILAMQVAIFVRLKRHDNLDAHTNYLIVAVEKTHDRMENLLRDAAASQAEEVRANAAASRQDTQVAMENVARLLVEQVSHMSTRQGATLDASTQQLAQITAGLDAKADALRAAMDSRMSQFATIIRDNGAHDRSESKGNFDTFREGMLGRFDMLTGRQKEQLESLQAVLTTAALHNAEQLDGMRDDTQRRLSQAQTDMHQANAQGREEIASNFKYLSEMVLAQMTHMADAQHQQLQRTEVAVNGLTVANETKLERLREAVDGRLQSIQVDNSEKLEAMRNTVDEKLHATLERRLGESFDYVSERLELVHQGLSEMQTLTRGVGELRRVIADTKVRGNWGEVKLSNLLEQMLTPDQYVTGVLPHPQARQSVDFAVKLPGHESPHQTVLLPIDKSII